MIFAMFFGHLITFIMNQVLYQLNFRFSNLVIKMWTYSLNSSSSQQDCCTFKWKTKSVTFCVWKTVKNMLSSLISLFYCYLFIVQGLHFPLYSVFLWVIYHLFSLELVQQNRHLLYNLSDNYWACYEMNEPYFRNICFSP